MGVHVGGGDKAQGNLGEADLSEVDLSSLIGAVATAVLAGDLPDTQKL